MRGFITTTYGKLSFLSAVLFLLSISWSVNLALLGELTPERLLSWEAAFVVVLFNLTGVLVVSESIGRKSNQPTSHKMIIIGLIAAHLMVLGAYLLYCALNY